MCHQTLKDVLCQEATLKRADSENPLTAPFEKEVLDLQWPTEVLKVYLN